MRFTYKLRLMIFRCFYSCSDYIMKINFDSVYILQSRNAQITQQKRNNNNKEIIKIKIKIRLHIETPFTCAQCYQ